MKSFLTALNDPPENGLSGGTLVAIRLNQATFLWHCSRDTHSNPLSYHNDIDGQVFGVRPLTFGPSAKTNTKLLLRIKIEKIQAVDLE